MPVTRSATKKMRRDEKARVVNMRRKRIVKAAVKEAKENTTVDKVREAISKIDKAVKKHLIPKNRAARMKSQLMRSINQTATTVAQKTAPKAATKAKAKKTTAKKTSKTSKK